jgi:transcriptional regulator with XRE-family HTH domain
MPNLKKMRQTTGVPMPHNGELVKQVMKAQRLTLSQMTRLMDITPSGIREYLARPTLHAALLWKLGQVLEHNFLAELSMAFPIQVPTALELELQQALKAKQAEMETLQKILDFVRPGR